MKAVLKVLLTVLTHRVTYRFLAVLLVALGCASAESVATGLETILCAIAGPCS